MKVYRMKFDKVPTSKDVALLAGVSQSTVSRAFSPKANLAPETRQKVMEAAKVLNYQPNALARGLVMSQSDIIAVVKGYTQNAIFSNILSEIVYLLQQADKRVIYFEAKENESIDDLAHKIMRYQIEGLVLLYVNLASELTAYCKQRQIPVLQIHRHSISVTTNAVLPDNYAAAGEAARLFIDKGYRNFAYLAGNIDSSTNMERQLGFQKVLQSNGYHSPTILQGDYTYESGMEAMKKMLPKLTLPVAILSANDLMAYGAIDVLKYEYSMKLGKDVGIAGFDNLPMGNWPSYRLTSFAQPIAQMAKEGIELLFANIKNRNMVPVERRYPMTLIERESV